MTRRLFVLVPLACALLVLAVAGGADPEAAGPRQRPADPRQAELLRSGGERYASYVRAELQSLEEQRRVPDAAAASIHANRVAPALTVARGPVNRAAAAARGDSGGPAGRAAAVARAVARRPRRAVLAAAGLLSADARSVRSTPLVGIEARVAGAALAFDGVRDALWDRDKGLTGSIDERLSTVRAELDRHRRGRGFRSSADLPIGDARSLAAALDAYAWRLSLAAGRVG